MPKGHSIPSMMDNEVVALFYTCLKCNEGAINFQKVATMLGLKDAAVAKGRLQRVMKAQEKRGAQAEHGLVEDAKINAVARKWGRPAKKRKADVEEEPESQEEDGRMDAKQLYQTLNYIEEGEKV